MSDLKQRIERILELRAKATPGQWYQQGVDVMCKTAATDYPLFIARTVQTVNDDGVFIAAAHEMADLLAELLPMVDDARRYQYIKRHAVLKDGAFGIAFTCPLGFSVVEVNGLNGHIDAQMNKENTNE